MVETRGFGVAHVLREIKRPTGEVETVMNFMGVKGRTPQMSQQGFAEQVFGGTGNLPVHGGGMWNLPDFSLFSAPKMGYIPSTELGVLSGVLSGVKPSRVSQSDRGIQYRQDMMDEMMFGQ